MTKRELYRINKLYHEYARFCPVEGYFKVAYKGLAIRSKNTAALYSLFIKEVINRKKKEIVEDEEL